VKKVILNVMIFGFVGLIFGSAGGQTSENIIKLKKFGNCKGCFLERENLEGAKITLAVLNGVDLTGANLTGSHLNGTNLTKANLTEAILKDVVNFDEAKKCQTILPWGEDNSGCK